MFGSNLLTLSQFLFKYLLRSRLFFNCLLRRSCSQEDYLKKTTYFFKKSKHHLKLYLPTTFQPKKKQNKKTQKNRKQKNKQLHTHSPPPPKKKKKTPTSTYLNPYVVFPPKSIFFQSPSKGQLLKYFFRAGCMIPRPGDWFCGGCSARNCSDRFYCRLAMEGAYDVGAGDRGG